MKKVLCAVFLTALLSGIGCFPATPASRGIDETLAPYQAVIDRLNRELGLNMYIYDKEKLYASVQNKTPVQFEATLRAEAQTADPNYRKSAKSEYFQTSSGSETKNYNYSSGMGKQSGAIPLPNAQGNLKVTPLE